MLANPQPSKYRNAAGRACVLALALGTAFAAWGSQGQQVGSERIVLRDLPVGKTQLKPPVYPEYAAEHNLSGTIVLVVDVAADGSVVDAVIERSEPKGVFDEAALKAVKKWKFTPAMEDGKPVASRVRVPIEFRQEPLKDVEKAPVGAGTEVLDASYEWAPVVASAGDSDCDKGAILEPHPGSTVAYCGTRKR